MGKLYFRYGAMGSGKTRDIIKVWYNYAEKGKRAMIIKPSDDIKGDRKIVSRDSNQLEVDCLIAPEDNLYEIISKYMMNTDVHCVLVDEAQFLRRHHVEELCEIADDMEIPVICYGLRADFQDNLFTGSEALFIYADVIEELKTICECLDGATRNVRFVDGKPVFHGEQIVIDNDKTGKVSYTSMCRSCRKKLLIKESTNKKGRKY